jgi:hypothetical protein
MKRIVLVLPFIVMIVLGSAAHAAGPGDPASPTALAALEHIKKLTGEWRTPAGPNQMINIFRPIAFGTAVLHEEWTKGEQLTATVFYIVGDELRADHFCDFKNQLHYVVKQGGGNDTISFELKDATNLDLFPRHFHSSTWRFVDDTHLTQDWQITGDGKSPANAHLDFTRQP